LKFNRGAGLAPALGWFTEGVDTPDLIEAQALLLKMAGLHTIGTAVGVCRNARPL
jgi:hypothetical protein